MTEKFSLKNTGVLLGIIVIIALSAIVYFVSMNSGADSGARVPPDICAQRALDYINTNLPPADSQPSSIVSVTDRHGVYEIVVRYSGRNTTVYATKDCGLLFTRTYTLNLSAGTSTVPVQTTKAAATTTAPQKSGRPAVDLYVMSFCPYGVQAETAMKPVAALLGTTADFRVHYIVTVTNSSVEGIRSLHGTEEAKEDLRQLCIMKYYPEKFWAYVERFNARCYPGLKDASALDRCWRNVSSGLGIDAGRVAGCASGSEGMAMITDDFRATSEKRITGSPTIQINSQTYSGQRTPEAYKQAVCARFISPPPECSANLSAFQSGQVSGSCG